MIQIIKNLIRMINSYRFSIITIIFFEILYLFKGYRVNKINFSKNDLMTDNIPCPYYFLFKIKKALKKRDLSDTKRKNSPLRLPLSAYIVDTSKLDKKQMLKKLSKIIEKKLQAKYGRKYKIK